jgi:hypothetical protein
MSKDLAFEYAEIEAIENPPVIIEQESSEFVELMKKMQSKELTLSYSSLKAFAKSPRNFIKYKLQKKTPQSESQIFGSLCDCLLTTPEKFDELYIIVDSIPNTENQIGFCQGLIEGMTPEDSKKANNPRGDAKELANLYAPYCEAIKKGKAIITSKLKEEATAIVDNLKKSDFVMQFIDSCTSFQNKREWTYNGWKFIGFTDAEGHNIIIDFKYSRDADPDKFERDIQNYDYFMQMGMYLDSVEGIPECYFIVYDKSFNFSVIKVDYSYLNYGIRKYKYLVAKLEDCINNNRWSESYNFWDIQIRTAFKPGWVKGFEIDTDTLE